MKKYVFSFLIPVLLALVSCDRVRDVQPQTDGKVTRRRNQLGSRI